MLNVSIDSKELIALLNKVAVTVNVKSNIPVLSHVLLSTLGNSLVARGTDLDNTVTAITEATVMSPGQSLAPLKELLKYVRTLKGTVQLSVENSQNMLFIECYGLTRAFPCLPVEDMPAAPVKPETSTEFVAPFQALLEATEHAMSNDDGRYVLNGIYLEFAACGKVTATATDGRRLATVQAKGNNNAGTAGRFILRSDSVEQLLKLCKKEPILSVHVWVNPNGVNQAWFQFGSCNLICKGIEGTFPNYRQVIPGKPKTTVSINRLSAVDVFKRAQLATTEKNVSVKLELADSTLTVTAGANGTSFKQSVPVQWRGETVPAIGINPRYLIESLESVHASNVTLGFTYDSNPKSPLFSPVLMRPRGDKQCLHVIMPMRLS